MVELPILATVLSLAALFTAFALAARWSPPAAKVDPDEEEWWSAIR